MGYNTQATEWPSCGIVPDAKKHAIDALFSLLDDDNENVGNRLADEVFSSDAVLMSSAGIAQGSEGMCTAKSLLHFSPFTRGFFVCFLSCGLCLKVFQIDGHHCSKKNCTDVLVVVLSSDSQQQK